jgi:hypothetical protein
MADTKVLRDTSIVSTVLKGRENSKEGVPWRWRS